MSKKCSSYVLSKFACSISGLAESTKGPSKMQTSVGCCCKWFIRSLSGSLAVLSAKLNGPDAMTTFSGCETLKSSLNGDSGMSNN